MINIQNAFALFSEEREQSFSGFRLIALVALFLFAIPSASAQVDNVTLDEIHEVAERMYCPICENEPLDDCRAATCMQWKEEIGEQLAAGRTPDQIIDDFVARFGEHVVGVPQDPLLRGLSLVTPIIVTLLALVFGVMTFLRWQTGEKPKIAPDTDAPPDHAANAYRQRLEQDLG